MSKTDKLFFPALTGYRAIAAWMIFVYHFMPFNNPNYPGWIKNIVSQFHIGVDLFFVLSGFLITYRYFNDYPLHLRKYLVNRVARIYPMYFLITILVFLVWFFQNGVWTPEKTKEALLSITMTKALFRKYSLVGIPQGWTLTLEELFYFTAPLYFILIRKSKKWLVFLPIIIFFFGVFLAKITETQENIWGFLQTGISKFIFEFFAGIALALFLLRRKNFKQTQWVTGFGIFIILFYLAGKNYWHLLLPYNNEFFTSIEMIFLSFLGIAPLLYGLIFEKTIVQRILGSKIFVLLGKSSYIFYLIHKGFLPIFINDYISDNKLVIFLLINIISILLFIGIEEPANLLIRKKFGKVKT